MKSPSDTLKKVLLTPEAAQNMLEFNKANRPLNDQHVKRIARQIREGKWRFNGDTIKIAETNDILDGQHRLWAIFEAQTPVETIVVTGIKADAFATIDTLRKPRSGSDVLALKGVTGARSSVSVALQWLIRWQRKVLESYKAPANRIENSDIEEAYDNNPGIIRAVERANKLRAVGNPGLLAFFYYVLTNRNPELAERLMYTLEDPSRTPMNDGFYRLRYYLVNNRDRKDALVSIALMIKAANAVHEERELKNLSWRNQGQNPEPFPVLSVAPGEINPK